MKKQYKLWLILLLIALAILLPGCKGEKTPGSETNPPVDETPVVQDLAIVSEGKTEYIIIVQENASEKITAAARSVMNAIQEVTGVKPDWTDDYIENGSAPNTKEILVGPTNRAESAQVTEDLAYGEYAIRIVDEKLVITAWDEKSLAEACRAFEKKIKKLGGEGQLTIPHDYAVLDTGFAELQQLPHYGEADEHVQFVDLADECYMLFADDTDETEFKAYFDALEGAGYTQFATRQMGDNLYATYVSDDKVVNASYIASKKDARIAIQDSYDLTLFTDQPYEKICEPSVTMVGLESYGWDEAEGVGNQIGLCMIFRMADGRFVIVDGGNYDNATIPLIQNNLKKLAVDPKNIVVAAWIMTHAHGDHTGAFCKYSQTSYKNTITVQNFVHHFSTAEQYENCDDAGRADQTRQLMRTYKGTNIIKVHTGQVMKIAGAEFEMLYTSADMEPYKLDYHNTTSLVFRVTVEDNTVMMLGDASPDTSSHLVKIYKQYLKSDIVQIAHHGFQGGSPSLYKAIDARVALWPVGLASVDGSYKNLTEREYNAKAVELADEVYVAGKTVHTITLPYTPAENDKAKFYT